MPNQTASAGIKANNMIVLTLARILFGESVQRSGTKMTLEERSESWQANRGQYVQLARRLVTKMRKHGIIITVGD